MAIEKINHELCVGCGTCSNTCSMDVIRLRKVASDFDEFSPCRWACPAGVNTREYIDLFRSGRMEEAFAVIREALPMPAITGYVCFHPCEDECGRKNVDEPVNINGIERYIAENWLIYEKPKPIKPLWNRKVAVIGAGPAGLSAAYYLVKLGYPVSIFEAEALPGGMLRYGIPEYRLPRNILENQIDYILGLGVEIKTNVKFGKDLTLDDVHSREFVAVLLATGAQESKKLNLDGIHHPDVYQGLEFLRLVNTKKYPHIKDKVVVVGGGNVAMDVAMCCIRLGAKQVEVVCLENEKEMPAHREAVQLAVEEGIKIVNSWGPNRLLFDGNKLNGLELVYCKSVYAANRTFSPVFDNTKLKTINAEMVIFAIGEKPDMSILPQGLAVNGEVVRADPIAMQTTLPGVFAAGVLAYGPGIVVEAFASGKKAARAIDNYIKGLHNKRDTISLVKKTPVEGVPLLPRQKNTLAPIEQRKKDFRLIKNSLSEDQFSCEIQRCMSCGYKAHIMYSEDCMTCYSCELDCPQKAIYVAPTFAQPLVSCWG